ncbi:MAG TPA: SpoIIE family protein phosphatase [Thermoleophilaceae bacterium]|nr:SpoIIE family protein phosphatase [Thermoleophilaceae bacterium]
MTAISDTSATPAADRPSLRERTLARLVEHVRTLIPAGAVTFVSVRRGEVEDTAGWFADERLREATELLAEAVARRDRMLLLPRLDAWEAALTLPAPAGAPLAAASVAACPLRTSTGEVVGALVVASLDPQHPLRRSDLGTVEVVADLAAMALERATLLEDEGRRVREEICLKRAAESISESLELEEVYRRVAEHAAEVTGAQQALLTRLNARSGELRTAASVELRKTPAAPLAADGDRAAGGAPRAAPAIDSESFGRVARTRRPHRDTGAGGSRMHAPIEIGPRLYGVLTVTHEKSSRFGDDDLQLLARLARSSAAAIANAIDFGRERRLARTLTLGFVPQPLPGLAGYETGLLYAPALGEPTGGDVYGAWPLPDGDIAVLVGDVAGKGVENAALSAMVRFFVEARSWDTRSPAAVLEQTNAMLMGRLPPDTFVTAFYGVLSPGRLVWAGAGHFPPVHVSGPCVRVLESRGLPLGVDLSPKYRERELELVAGDMVFAFTDGLVEARRDRETYGSDRLARLVGRLAQSLGPQELVTAVHDEIADWSGGLVDDAVALALRRRR